MSLPVHIASVSRASLVIIYSLNSWVLFEYKLIEVVIIELRTTCTSGTIYYLIFSFFSTGNIFMVLLSAIGIEKHLGMFTNTAPWASICETD